MTESIDIECMKFVAKKIMTFAPQESKKIILTASLSDEGDVGDFSYDYTSKSGEVGWFLPGGGASQEQILKKLIEHRDFLVSQGQPKWSECALSIDLDNGKVSMDLKYD